MPDPAADGARRTPVVLEDIHVSFGEKKVLCGLDLAVEKGEVLVILGRSGGGKSVTLKTICGLLRPNAGRVTCLRKDLLALDEQDLRRLRRRIGYVFQSGALINWLTAAENIALPMIENDLFPPAEVESRVQDALDAVGLSDAGPRYAAELSGGMRKRVSLARSVAQEPAVLLYDEPTTGLDPISTASIDQLVLETRDRVGVTSVVISHDLASAWRIADRIAMLHEGRILACLPPDEFREHPHPAIRAFLDASPE